MTRWWWWSRASNLMAPMPASRLYAKPPCNSVNQPPMPSKNFGWSEQPVLFKLSLQQTTSHHRWDTDWWLALAKPIDDALIFDPTTTSFWIQATKRTLLDQEWIHLRNHLETRTPESLTTDERLTTCIKTNFFRISPVKRYANTNAKSGIPPRVSSLEENIMPANNLSSLKWNEEGELSPQDTWNLVTKLTKSEDDSKASNLLHLSSKHIHARRKKKHKA